MRKELQKALQKFSFSGDPNMICESNALLVSRHLLNFMGMHLRRASLQPVQTPLQQDLELASPDKQLSHGGSKRT